jgi:hypothetical protein
VNTPHESGVIIEDVRFLLDTGEDPERIAQRLGYSPRSLERALDRWGEKDLARVFGRVLRPLRH